MNNIAIIGGGASGMACAVMLSKLDPNLKISLFDTNSRLGKKLSVTGNGRCNISNKYASKENYHGDGELAQRLLNYFNYSEQKDFFHSIGVPIIEENEGKAYPMSLQANSVIDAFRFALTENQVNIYLESTVEDVDYSNNVFTLNVNNRKMKFDAIVIATGGKASVKNFNDFGYRILKKFGHKIEPISPSLVQIKTNTETVKQLKGIKINGRIKISNEIETKIEEGEILFCDYGISGPPVMQLSRYANTNTIIKIDLIPHLTEQDILKELEFRTKTFPQREVSELFTGMINKRIGQVITKNCNIPLNLPVKQLSITDITRLSKSIKSLELKVTGLNGFENAQVTAGGAQTTQFFDTMMSKKIKGLFATGEVLNVDGDCGGYNLSYCWASAYAAANGIINYFQSKEKS